MNRLRDLALILLLAAWWAVGGYLIGLALETIGFDAYRFGLMLAAINVIIGLVLFLNFTADPPTERVFFEQSMRRGLRNPRVGCLWVMPLFIFVFGVSMWVWAVVLRLIIGK